MAKIIPFRGLRYDESKVGKLRDVVTPPYDIISPEQQQAYYEKNEYNVIRLEYGMEYDEDTVTENRYTRAAAFLSSWISEGVLRFEDEECLYLYEQRFVYKRQEFTYRGFISRVQLEDFANGVILPHEETLSKAKADRFNLMCTTSANFSQIYCLYIDEEKQIDAVIKSITKQEADVSFTDENDIVQSLWIIRDKSVIDQVVGLFADKQLFIADGHHRYETALAYRDKMRAEKPAYNQNDGFESVMMMLVDMDDPGLIVFPTHRMVQGVKFDEVRVISALKDNFEINKIIVDQDAGELCSAMEQDLASLKDKNCFALYCGGDYYYRLYLSNPAVMEQFLPDCSDAYRRLDVSVLHTLVLEQILGIDSENLKSQKNLTYTRDACEAVRSVQEGEQTCAFVLNPTKVHEIKDVSLAGEKMPQKSTYFYPKLITGLVMNKL